MLGKVRLRYCPSFESSFETESQRLKKLMDFSMKKIIIIDWARQHLRFHLQFPVKAGNCKGPHFEGKHLEKWKILLNFS